MQDHETHDMRMTSFLTLRDYFHECNKRYKGSLYGVWLRGDAAIALD